MYKFVSCALTLVCVDQRLHLAVGPGQQPPLGQRSLVQ